jgi:hypothetical protein
LHGPVFRPKLGAWQPASSPSISTTRAPTPTSPRTRPVSWSDGRLEWLPYTLEIPEFLGTVEGRNAHQRRCIRYSYMDARRLANRRGLTVRGPQKIFDWSIAAIGMLYAQRHDVFRKYYDLVFERFWKRALDIENRESDSSGARGGRCAGRWLP